MSQSSKNSSKEKKLKRKEVLEGKKVIDGIIKKASSVKDHLVSFPPFSSYQRNGVSVILESGNGDELSSSTKKYIQNLLKANMEGPYGKEWATEEKVKRREMVDSEARYIFIKQTDDGQVDGPDRLMGFAHYRFVVEEDLPVVYVYELQLESCVQGKGLGKFLMQLIELIARKNEMKAVMLTVQKANVLAINFYTNKMRYVMSSISPTRVNIQIGAETSYEIYCKTFDSEAKAILEDGSYKVAMGSSGNGDVFTVGQAEVDVVRPEKFDKVMITSGYLRGFSGKLVLIDGSDGIVEMNGSYDVTILKLSCLTKTIS